MANISCVWSPRYWDRQVLVSTQCVQPRKCYVYFAADRNYKNLYSYDGEKVMQKCPVQKNGHGTVYVIPMSWLNDEGKLPERFIPDRDAEYEKYKKYQEKQKPKQ